MKIEKEKVNKMLFKIKPSRKLDINKEGFIK